MKVCHIPALCLFMASCTSPQQNGRVDVPISVGGCVDGSSGVDDGGNRDFVMNRKGGALHVGRMEVTVGSYRKLLGRTPCGGVANSTPTNVPKQGSGHTAADRECCFYLPRTQADAEPITCITPIEALEYLNERSRAEGLQPVFNLDSPGQGGGYAVNPKANGYRLPTQEEWLLLLDSDQAATLSKNTVSNTENICAVANVLGEDALIQAESAPARDRLGSLSHFSCSDGQRGPTASGAAYKNSCGLHGVLGNVAEFVLQSDAIESVMCTGETTLYIAGLSYSDGPDQAVLRPAHRVCETTVSGAIHPDVGFRYVRLVENGLAQSAPRPDGRSQ